MKLKAEHMHLECFLCQILVIFLNSKWYFQPITNCFMRVRRENCSNKLEIITVTP